jgi:hypothetical protein
MNKARDLLKAAKLKKLQTIHEPQEAYQVEAPSEMLCSEETTGNTSTDKTNSADENKKDEIVIEERQDQNNLLKEKLALYEKINKEPQLFKGGSFLGFNKKVVGAGNTGTRQEPKKLFGAHVQKDVKEYVEELDIPEEQLPKADEKDLKEKLMKRMTSAKLNKGGNNNNNTNNVGNKFPNKVAGLAGFLENKIAMTINNENKKKFILEDSDIQRIEISDGYKPLIQKDTYQKRDILEIIMEKPVIKGVRKMKKKSIDFN